MRSFSNYRKQCIKESLDKFSARGSSQALFDILRIDLLETTELPELITENLIAKSEFNRFRNEFKNNNRYIVESVCEYAKNSFYDHLMQEADEITKSAIDPASAFRMLRDELKVKLSQMVKELKIAVSDAMSSSIDSGSEMDMGNSPEQSTSDYSPVNNPTGAQPSPSPSNNGGGRQPSPSPSNNGGQPNNQSQQSASGNRPSVGSAWSDLMASLRPADGWFGGIKRSIMNPIRDAGRYLKKNWYGEHQDLIEEMLLEQNSHVIDMIDKFEKDILKWFDSRSAEIAKDAGIDLNAAGISQPSVLNPTNTIDPKSPNGTAVEEIPQDYVPVGTQYQKQANGTDEKVITGGAKELIKSAKKGDPVAIKKTITHIQNLKKACDILEIKTNRQEDWADGVTPKIRIKDVELDLAGTKAQDFEATYTKKKKAIGGSGRAMIKEIANRIFLALGHKPTPDLFIDPKNPASDPIVNRVWTDLPGGGGDLTHMTYPEIVAQLLVRFGAKYTGSVEASQDQAPMDTNVQSSQDQAPMEKTKERLQKPTAKSVLARKAIKEIESKSKDNQHVKALIDKLGNERFVQIVNNSINGLQDISGDLGEILAQTVVPNLMKVATEEEPIEVPQDVAPEEKPTEVPQDVAPEEKPIEVPQDVAPEEKPTEVPQDVAPEEKPTEVPQDNDLNNLLKSPEEQPVQPEKPVKSSKLSDLRNRSPQSKFETFHKALDKVISNLGANNPELAENLMDKWIAIKSKTSKDPYKESEPRRKQLDSDIANNAEGAISDFKQELLEMKAKELGLPTGNSEPVEESLITMIQKYKKLIKESSVPTKSLRERLGLDS